jgi:crotonobetainyl-CoA:carnitine CoA-transferase CaiB-like acyl-CoA transferase
MADQPLSGAKVLDLTWYIAGPYCTKLLADQGADVLKIERPGEGDPARKIGPFLGDDPHPEKSGLFLYLNTSKRSITLNLKTEAGKKVFKELAREADAVVESFRPGAMAELGLDYETLEKLNPKLVMVSISNFGQSGPYRDFKAAHIIEDAMAGWMYLLGEPDREPLQVGGWFTHYAAGLCAAVATTAALYYQRDTGQGQYVDLSMMEAMIPLQTFNTVMHSYLGWSRVRVGNVFVFGFGYIPPVQDGYLGVNAYTNPQWEELCRFVGMPELLEEPKYKTIFGRREYAREITERIDPWFRDKKKEETFHAAQERRIPFGLIPTTEDLVNLPQLQAREWFVEVEHPVTGKVTYPGAPFKTSETPWRVRHGAPLLGEHNWEVYGKQLGYSREDMVRLKERGVI